VSGIGNYVCRFHPTKPVLACLFEDEDEDVTKYEVTLLSAENLFIPFSNWKEKEIQLQLDGNLGRPYTIEWNVSRAYIFLYT
jgi:hypothetical protein